MRIKGSCKFNPYWKAERWNERLSCWQVVMKAYDTLELAQLHVKISPGKYRITEATEKGYRIL